ncbi:hypothetical protein ACR30L_03990 [Psychromonas sp. PT13]|uniref:hypothetical protein n=1 Tax=Psychromonas sp. PT13 TaxID=3439547 RepID=UPI003EB75617
MDCPINGLTFGKQSQKSLDEIRRLTKTANWLSIALAGSVLNNIFFRNGPVAVSYNIKTTDFKLMANSMSSTNPILKRKVNEEASKIMLFNSSSLSFKEKTFWRCFYNETR